MTIRIVDVTDDASFGLIPPCADPSFDHRTCDYWEDADRGSKAARPAWLAGAPPPAPKQRPANPFAAAFSDASDDSTADEAPVNPFAPPAPAGPSFNPFAIGDDDALAGNPFAPPRPARPTGTASGPRKLGLLARGSAVFGSYAKVLLADDTPVAYSQFGPLSAYPRAQRLRDLYPQLPQAPLPAVITCIATTADARRQGHALRLIAAVCDDLAGRGFAAVEAYPERSTRPDATSAATPEFWVAAGFKIAVEDERFPVVRRELG
jgi:ribosomal protein S18 acetylase RimI-like enzyme